MRGFRGYDEFPHTGDGAVGFVVQALRQVRQDLGEEGVADAQEMELFGTGDNRLETARGLGKLAALIGDEPEERRGPSRRKGQGVCLSELQLVGGGLLATREAPRLPEHRDAPKVAPD